MHQAAYCKVGNEQSDAEEKYYGYGGCGFYTHFYSLFLQIYAIFQIITQFFLSPGHKIHQICIGRIVTHFNSSGYETS